MPLSHWLAPSLNQRKALMEKQAHHYREGEIFWVTRMSDSPPPWCVFPPLALLQLLRNDGPNGNLKSYSSQLRDSYQCVQQVGHGWEFGVRGDGQE